MDMQPSCCGKAVLCLLLCTVGAHSSMCSHKHSSQQCTSAHLHRKLQLREPSSAVSASRVDQAHFVSAPGSAGVHGKPGRGEPLHCSLFWKFDEAIFPHFVRLRWWAAWGRCMLTAQSYGRNLCFM